MLAAGIHLRPCGRMPRSEPPARGSSHAQAGGALHGVWWSRPPRRSSPSPANDPPAASIRRTPATSARTRHPAMRGADL